MLRPLPTAEEVANFLDRDDAAAIERHVNSVITFVRSYTRGVGFAETTEGEFCQRDLAAVIVSATARSVTNPTQAIRIEVGAYSELPARFDGWTLAEQAVLHGYRRRTA